MQRKLVTIVRRSLTGGWLLVIAGLLGIGALTHLTTTFVIRGGSMEPAIPVGSLIVEEAVTPDEVRVGDVITVRADNGMVLSHRVTRVLQIGAARYFEVKGDANQTPDPALVPAGSLIGRVGLELPVAGYAAAMLGTPSGLVSLLAMLAAGLLMIVLAEELEAELSERGGTAGAAASEGSPRGALA